MLAILLVLAAKSFSVLGRLKVCVLKMLHKRPLLADPVPDILSMMQRNDLSQITSLFQDGVAAAVCVKAVIVSSLAKMMSTC